MRLYFLLLLSFFFLHEITAQKGELMFLPADAKEIHYAGRISFSDSKRPTFCHSGVSIKTIFNGTAIAMEFIDHAEGGDKFVNYYTIILDDRVVQTLEMRPGKHVYELASGLAKEKHTIEVFKRTECAVGSSTFCGFRADKGTVFEKPLAKAHRIEFIGDSFTCGYGNEVSIAAAPEGNPGTGFHSKNENHYMTYGPMITRALNTECRAVAYSGRGMYRNNAGDDEGTLPKIYERIFPDDPQSILWDVKKEIPDVIVIKLGANDFFPESRGDELNDHEFIITYINFLERLRNYYPKAKIICITGVSMSDTWPEGRNCLTRIQKDVKDAVEQRKLKGDQQIYYFKLDQQTAPYGEDWHATIATHQRMAEQFTPFIKEITGW